MAVNIVNLISKALLPTTTQSNISVNPVSGNPFSNPFVNNNTQNHYTSYAKNKPVQGGYFAGYYNGKANIVGQRLFLEA